MNKRGKIAVSTIEIAILIISLFAFAYFIGQEFRVVRAGFPINQIVTFKSGDTWKKVAENKWEWVSGGNDPGAYITDKQILDSIGKEDISVGSPSVTDKPTQSVGFFQSIYGYAEGTGITYTDSTNTIIKTPGPGWLTGGGWTDMIVSSAAWGLSVYFGVKMIGGWLGWEQNTIDAASSALGWGAFAGKGAASLVTSGKWKGLTTFVTDKLGWSAGGFGFAVGVVTTIVIYLWMYKDDSYKIVTFECDPWEAPTGGADCEKCNEGILKCTEYQCRALGQACEIVNAGTEEQKCIWKDRRDTSFPIIEPWRDVLTVDHKYAPDNTISPPDKGVKIEYEKSTDKCIKAFTPLSFGVILNEPAQCKLDYTRKSAYDNMGFYFGGSKLYRYNHTQVLSLPGPSAINNESPILENDGNYELFVRCMDANGNYNTADFLFRFCVDKGPDTTPPLIVTTSLLNGMPVAYNTTQTNIDVYVNEPATCRWSINDMDYDDMETEMACSSSVFEANAQMLYKCSTTLNGLKNRQENKFYFRCKDQPKAKENDRNENKESLEFTVWGSEPLIIDWVKPNETIRDSTSPVKVTLEAKTSAGAGRVISNGGARDGEASCYYSSTGKDNSYILFFKTGGHEHSQELSLLPGAYTYYIKCLDLGGNADQKKLEFSVESDNIAPTIVRVYHYGTNLKLITNEKAECVYATDTCSYRFEDGTKMRAQKDDLEHYAEWNTNFNYYIKCKDKFGNQPIANECNMVVRAFELIKGNNAV